MGTPSSVVYVGEFNASTPGTGHKRRVLLLMYLRRLDQSIAKAIHRFFHAIKSSHLRFPTISSLKIHRPNITLPGPGKIPWTNTKGVSFTSFGAGVIAAALFVFIPYQAYAWLAALPNPHLLTSRDIPVTTKIFDRNGILLYQIYTDQNRTLLPLKEIPKFVVQATLAIEDTDFYRHNGISLKGIIRAARSTFFEKQKQGGSTITQQLIKSALLTPEMTFSRKIKEAALALWTEHLYTKDQILEMYLNQVPYGHTAWGIEAASHMYFGKSTQSLTLAEAALLAGLPAAPSEYSPFGNFPHKAIERQHQVIDRMTAEGYITKAQAEEAKNQPVTFAPLATNIRAPHFVMYIKDILENRYGSRLVAQGGLRVKTSLDLGVQEQAEDTLRLELDKLASASANVGNGAVVVTNPSTGEVLAMAGSKNYWDIKNQGNVNAVTTLQQPGSTAKVINYAAALERGDFTAATVLNDSPVVYKIAGSETYIPKNYDGIFHGFVPLRYALANSYNIPAVRTLDAIGVTTMLQKGKAMGVDTWKKDGQYGLSLTLGGADVTMLDMARVYGTLANNGKRVNLMPILDVTDYRGRTLEHNKPKSGTQAVREEAAWIIGDILRDNNARSQAFGAHSLLTIPGRSVAVKTGTTNEKRDNWAIGYTPSYVVTVWVGNNDNTPMNQYVASGITGATPIWNSVMNNLTKDKPDELPSKPSGVVSIPCHFGRTEYFMKGTEPAGGRCAPIPTPTPTPAETPTP
ncbi:hypothetical protein A2973_00920 [Candidatus Gottesmanbacteria bacterium RIFCSPLOWO2_01_FULL_49_10]|uniref:Uncharacterized protein n=1 Tax=Candidatus Gottesmanbacteria bacterium RIFCSPLOWO2_01_FULL_49_10 TaxID=1798396 RepID=A0A1F6AYT5_9BACT|nr:MAG: hypothetical protein A2973_00920 [Candidatus Gottesmanbacteria bacterium RIFCSPLOWO2_01_FULL_49_10]